MRVRSRLGVVYIIYFLFLSPINVIQFRTYCKSEINENLIDAGKNSIHIFYSKY